MMKVVLCNEFGGGYGHLAMLRPIAELLQARGARVSLYLGEAQSIPDALKPPNLPVRAAPPLRAFPLVPLRGFEDMLFSLGMADAPYLRARVGAWSRLFDVEQPDLVVGNYAPFALLAARAQIAAVCVGTGFEVPPDRQPALPLLDRIGAVDSRPLVLAAIRGLQRELRLPIPASLDEAFPPAPARFVVTIPELDPYGAWREAPRAGPLSVARAATHRASGHVFAYLSVQASATFRVLQGLNQVAERVLVVLRDGACPESWRLSLSRLEIQEAPLSQKEALDDCRVVVHHGGIALCQEAAFRSIPQIVIPTHDEQVLNGRAVRKMGIGDAFVNPQPALVRRIAERLPTDASTIATCRAVAHRLQREWLRGSLEAIVDYCLSASPGA